MSGHAEAWRFARFATAPAAVAAREAMAKLLQRDPGDTWALAPFAPLHDGDRWWIAANSAPIWTHWAATDDADDLGEILLICGRTGTVRWLGDDDAGIYGTPDFGDRVCCYTDGIAFARAWAAARADAMAAEKRGQEALRRPPRQDWGNSAFLPGFALVGELARIFDFGPLLTYRTVEIDNPRLRQPLANAMLRAARLPAVVTAPTLLKSAA